MHISNSFFRKWSQYNFTLLSLCGSFPIFGLHPSAARITDRPFNYNVF